MAENLLSVYVNGECPDQSVYLHREIASTQTNQDHHIFTESNRKSAIQI